MASFHPLETQLAEAWPPDDFSDVTVLLAVSGGADSVAMLRALHALKTGGVGRLVVGHVNHGLRGNESDEDERFVVGLAKRHGLACEVSTAHVRELAAIEGDGLEAAARTLRYERLRIMAEHVGARYLVTAHTADDQAETVMHRIVRGTGIRGLAGIPRLRMLSAATTLIRPMLRFRRAELLSYLKDLGQPYRVDASNADPRFTRNRIRHELLPLLARQFNENVVDALLRLATLADEIHGVTDALIVDLLEQCVEGLDRVTGPVRICTNRLVGQPRYLVREVAIAVWRLREWPQQAMGFPEWDHLATMIDEAANRAADVPKACTFPGKVQAEIFDSVLVLRRLR